MFWRIMLSSVLMIQKPWDAICLQETDPFPLSHRVSLAGSKATFLCCWRALAGFKHSGRISFSFALLLKCPRGACWSVDSPPTPHRRLHFLHSTSTTPDLSVSMCKSARLSLFVWPAVCPGCVLFIFHVYLCVVQLLSLTASLALLCHGDAGCLSVWLPPFCLTARLHAACYMPGRLSASLPHHLMREKQKV